MACRFQIEIIPIGRVQPSLLEFLLLSLTESMDADIRVRRWAVDLHRVYDAGRQQYDSRKILAQLANLDCRQRAKILGVTAVDLFIPILTFVFGEAQVGGRAAVVSIHRLRRTFYGLREDSRSLFERSEKEALHELGHTLGLVHCRLFDCVMHFSNSIEQVDLKSNRFCPSCHQALEARLAKNEASWGEDRVGLS